MAEEKSLSVAFVEPRSIAQSIGLKANDSIVSINGKPVRDIIDYYYLASEGTFVLEKEDASGIRRVLKVEKDEDEDLGARFVSDIPDGIRHCGNHCLFCFVDQMPPNLRDSLYVKDDDYRYSFLRGNYISLTNLNSTDWERILSMHLSPLYVSVHSTNPQLRSKIFGNPAAGNIMDQLQRLASGGITVHTQIVVCPDINDGEVLEETLKDLCSLWPSVQSVAVVPVGITKFNRSSTVLPVSAREAAMILDQVEDLQQRFASETGSRFVFAADELYLKAGRSMPPAHAYEDFPQFENGVGMVRSFIDEATTLLAGLQPGSIEKRNVVVVTGTSVPNLLRETGVQMMQRAEGLNVEILEVENRFFGPTVTVSGLLTGADVTQALKAHAAGRKGGNLTALLSAVALKDAGEVFLDGMSVAEVEKESLVRVEVVENSAEGLISYALGWEVKE